LRDAGAGGPAGGADGAVVLLGAVDVVGEILIERHAVELGGGLVHDSGPGPATIVGDVGAAVVAFDHAQRIVGSDPHAVVVPMRRTQAGPGAAAVDRLVEAHVEGIDGIGALRVSEDVGV